MEVWQLTQRQRNARFMAASGAVEYYKCRRFNWQRVKDAISYIGIGIFIGFILALAFAPYFQNLLM